ncbi:DNA polymerase III subunit [Caldisericum exile]|uniref:DNA polymerase III delta' subunit n=1 Tax=Caldisericum exile (strain DSM 21853 / NBRC 104410 / AZM16c01) TaxID=511051 RepID=A0A7U6GDW7_CALEA|nr:AAA family ATPase [Caldisericum exile]BAL80517.1 putative DNA polymerase III delta' subunit [Caldisericum exile AZM16c01]
MGLKRVLGQDKTINYLRKLLEKRNLPSTLIFVGPEGVGKKLTAVEFAKALNCKVDPLNGCDTCKSCIAIENRVHPNLKIIESDTIGIDDIRETIDNSYVPYEGIKVNIFVNVENATIQAFNSMLKFLEEPPKNTLNILTCENLENLPETIVSRGVVVKFEKLPFEVIKEIVKQFVEDDEKASTIAHILNGTLKNLSQLTKDEVYKKRKQLLTSFLNLIKKKETGTKFIVKFKDYYGDFNYITVNDFIDEAIDLLRDIIFIIVKKETEIVKNIDLLGFIADEFLAFNLKRLKDIYELLGKAKEGLLTNANTMHIILSVIFTIENM